MIDNKSFYASCECIRLGLDPMKTPLCVVSRQPGSKGGLIMAASPVAKKKYGLKNIQREWEIPPTWKTPDLLRVEPHMNLYIKRAMQIKQIFLKYCAEEDLHTYSIDESMLDMTSSWKLFGSDPYVVARKIQKEIHDELGLYTTCGIGENPLLAKLAMDISAKHRKSMIASWHYEDVPDTIWQIDKLEDVWSINTRTANHLRRLGINNMYDLAHAHPAILHKEFGVLGDQLFAISWGVDRSIISEKFIPKTKSYSNSQVLNRDYYDKKELSIVIREIGEQVAARIRAHGLQAGNVHLYIGYSMICEDKGFAIQSKITPTNSNQKLTAELIRLFFSKWQGQPVRTIGVSYGSLSPDNQQQLTFFMTPEQEEKQYKLDHIVDSIRHKYGFSSVVKASSLLPGATAIKRSNLVGGHNGGNAYE